MADNDNLTQNAGADESAPAPAAPAPAAPASAKPATVKAVKGWFRAKEDCWIGGSYGYKVEGAVFYYEGVPHDSLVATKAPAATQD